jgi:hypothetical protein
MELYHKKILKVNHTEEEEIEKEIQEMKITKGKMFIYIK